MKKLGIIVALPDEARCICRSQLIQHQPIEVQKGVFLCLSGIGPEAAKFAVQQLISCRVDGIISWGICGALASTLHAGTLVAPSKIMDVNRSCYLISPSWRRCVVQALNTVLRINDGAMISIDQFCTDTQQKDSLSRQYQAVAVDMESFAIAEQASRHHLDCLVLRVIADEQRTPIPKFIGRCTDQLGRPKIIPLILNCLRNPSDIVALYKLKKCYATALSGLEHIALALLLKRFYFDS